MALPHFSIEALDEEWGRLGDFTDYVKRKKKEPMEPKIGKVKDCERLSFGDSLTKRNGS
jgi:hypothetical protein